MNDCKLSTETFNDIILRYLKKVPFCIKLYQLYLNFPVTFSKNRHEYTIIIDIAISKTDTIISQIDNSHVDDLAHPKCTLFQLNKWTMKLFVQKALLSENHLIMAK